MYTELLSFIAVAEDEASLEVAELLASGRFRDAVAIAEEMLDDRIRVITGPDVQAGLLARLAGDLMLALGRLEDAEETYRIAVKHAGERRGAVRIASCRSSGFLNLYQQRFSNAMACFERIEADDAATVHDRVEAICALSMIWLSLGDSSAAQVMLRRAEAQLENVQDAKLRGLVALMHVERQVRSEVRSHELLDDHILWHDESREISETPPTPLKVCPGHPWLALRCTYLMNLRAYIRGDVSVQDNLSAYLSDLDKSGCHTLESQSRLDCALAGLAQRQVPFVKQVLEPLSRNRERRRLRGWNLELLYCRAKMEMLSGRYDAAIVHYQKYARASMEISRHISRSDHRSDSAMEPAADDVLVRLPAKYRRAYRYMCDNLDSAGLSVREIAEQIGVTERALQSAFKTYLGMTPGEVLQRCRMERIRADLLRDDATGTSVLATAARWGIRNRSTLMTSYRKFFQETPTQTIARKESAVEKTSVA